MHTKQDQHDSHLLTVQQAAKFLTASAEHVYALIRSGRLPAIRLGEKRGLRVARPDIERFLSSSATSPNTSASDERRAGGA